jgi:hypothetical protein
MSARIRLLLMAVTAAGLLAACGLVADSFDGPPRTYAVALADLDGDGDLDAVLANDQSERPTTPDTVWWNDGAGAFSDSRQRLDGLGSRHVTTGDFDGDGDEDVLFGVFGSGWLVTNNGAGQLGVRGHLLNTSDILIGPVSVAAGDLDGDEDLDAIVAVCCGTVVYGSSGQRHHPASTQVWLNDGTGRLRFRGQLLGDLGGQAVALGDLDGDGDLDAFLGNAFSTRDAQGTLSRNEPNTIWLNDGTGQFTDSGQRLGRTDTRAVALGDLDGDGDLDGLVGNNGADEVWLNDGLGNFTDSGQTLGDTLTRYAALGDLDGDGDLDAHVDTERGGAVWLNDGSGNFTAGKQGLAHAFDCASALGDVDGDGDLDIVAGCVDRAVLVWLNDGTGRFSR